MRMNSSSGFGEKQMFVVTLANNLISLSTDMKVSVLHSFSIFLLALLYLD